MVISTPWAASSVMSSFSVALVPSILLFSYPAPNKFRGHSGETGSWLSVSDYVDYTYMLTLHVLLSSAMLVATSKWLKLTG